MRWGCEGLSICGPSDQLEAITRYDPRVWPDIVWAWQASELLLDTGWGDKEAAGLPVEKAK